MLRVTTLHASSAVATASYYADYLTKDVTEPAGVWSGAQAAALGLTGDVTVEALTELLSGRDPITGTALGTPLVDRVRADGRTVRAVSGFDATFSAPKSLSVLWALTGDDRFAECHDIAVTAVADYLERFGATTRIRSNGSRLHPDANGLTMAAFRQSTSRLDDPQLHTHLIISSKVQTVDGRWMALDARMLMRHQRALGGLYQSVLRAEVTSRFGLTFEAIVNGQAEITGIPAAVLEQFSKRTRQVDTATAAKIVDFVTREGREPSRFERAAMEREASADTRGRKTGRTVAELRPKWIIEAAAHGVTPTTLVSRAWDTARDTARDSARDTLTVAEVIEYLSEQASAWHRLDVVRAICDLTPPQPGINGNQWMKGLDSAVDAVLAECVDLDPTDHSSRRASDGRSVWTEPVANRFTSTTVLEQEQTILDFATHHATAPSTPSTTIEAGALDVLQTEAAAAVAGRDGLVIVVGPAGAGKTTMLAAAITDLHTHHRPVYGIAPTGKAAQVLARETGIPADTVAKLLHEWRPDGPGPQAAWRLTAGTTVIVDEAGLVATGDLYRLTQLATRQQWRLVLVGDPRQLAAVGRSGMFEELVRTHPAVELEQLYRFTEPWEAHATLRLRAGDPRVLDTYFAHDRIHAGTLDNHVTTLTAAWFDERRDGGTLAITVATNEHAGHVNTAIQTARLQTGELDNTRHATTAGGVAYVGDVIATHHNQRNLRTSNGGAVRNRDRWTITGIDDRTGAITATRLGTQDSVMLPAGYVAEWVELAYAATDYGNQGDTFTASINLISDATTARGLYVAMTRGRHRNIALVITDTPDPNEARDTLVRVLATDRADTPAIVQRRQLAEAASGSALQQANDRRVVQPQTRTPANSPVPGPARRVPVPEWFGRVRADLVIELGALQAERQATADRGARRRAAVATAQQRLEEARVVCGPFDDAMAVARRELDRAVKVRDDAAERLARSRFLARRDAKAGVAQAEARVGQAQAAFDHAEAQRRPFHVERGYAFEALDRVERADREDGIIDHYLRDDGRVAGLEHRLVVLDRWKEWATGKPVTAKEIGRLHLALERELRFDWLRDDPLAMLADSLARWASVNNVELPAAQPTLAVPGQYLGIEL